MNKKVFRQLIDRSFANIHRPCAVNKHFSYLLIKNQVMAEGWNDAVKTDPLARKMGSEYATIHSELAAIKRFLHAPTYLRYCVLVNIRVNTHGKVLMSKPCKFCQRLLRHFEIRRIYYSTEHGMEELSCPTPLSSQNRPLSRR